MNDHEIYMYQKRIHELESEVEKYRNAIQAKGIYWPEGIISPRIRLLKNIESLSSGDSVSILVIKEDL